MKTTKRILALFIAFAFAFGCLTACVTSTTTTPIDNSGADSKAESKPGESANKAKVKIAEQVLFEQSGVKVTATGYKADGIFGDSVALLIENSSEVDVTVSCNELIVNNYMVSNLFSATVAAGKKSNESLDLLGSELEAAGITAVGLIEADFNVYEDESYENIFETDLIQIKTSAYDSMELVKQDQGQELVNRDGVRIVGKFVEENSIFGTAIVLFIENTGNKDVNVSVDDLSINGFMVESLMYDTVYKGKMAIADISLLDSDLKENGIAKINDIEVKFSVSEADSYETLFETEAIKFNTVK